MSTNQFFTAMSAVIPAEQVADKNGLSYLAAATAQALAGRPEITCVDFQGKPYLEMFNGAVVAVDLTIPGSNLVQRTWLPVLDQEHQPIELKNMSVVDINSSRQRAMVKAIASVLGHGMSLYIGHNGAGDKAVKALAINPDSDLSVTKPVVALLREAGAPFIEWGVGVAACRITDPMFHWSILEWDNKPYREILGGVFVDVQTVYKGKTQVLSLPVLDATHQPIPAGKVTVHDWNKTAMRILTKGIAFNSGYGLDIYADDFGSEVAKAAKGGAKSTKQKGAATDEAAKIAKAEGNAVKEQVAATGKSTAAADAKAKADAQAQAQAQAQAEAEADAQAQAKADAQAQAEADAQAQATAGTDAPTKDDAQAEPKAEAPAPAVATSAGEKVWPTPSEDGLQRFKTVMQNRRESHGATGLISLFEALAKSEKYSADDKPGCYVQLLSACASTVTGADVDLMLAAVKQHNALQYLDAQTREVIAARIVAEKLHIACDMGDMQLLAAPDQLIDAGFATDAADVIRLANAGNVMSETLVCLEGLMSAQA